MNQHLLLAFLAVSAGGALGAVLRYGAMLTTANWLKDPHHGTMLVNILGSLLVGYLLNLLPHDSGNNEFLRLAVITGVLGGFTTFSAFSMDTLLLLQNGEMGRAMLNIILTLSGTLIAVFIGYEAGRLIHAI
ncbi:MAG: fluoride efflux transporter CrcB [Xanthomonadales bacterium]|nr:fluoride efflux transporter CrcB [Xanthomonadales bacterium]